jgi:hypothetical protein
MYYEIGDIVFIENLPFEDVIVSKGKGLVVGVNGDSIGVLFNKEKNHSIHYFSVNQNGAYSYLRRVA